MICFVIAMRKEAEPIIAEMKNVEERKMYMPMITGTLYGREVGMIICGVGKVNATAGAEMAIYEFKPSQIINIGVAGGLNTDVKVGEIYEVSAAVQYDFDLTQLNGGKIGTLDGFEDNYLPLAHGNKYPLKKLATGDRFNDSPADLKLLTEVLHADVRDMEGGAIAQWCTRAGVKFRSFKIISDLAGSGSTTEQFLDNFALCARNLKKQLKNIMKDIDG